ncbi:peptidyl-tRNA hydrolase 2, mitochondrial-like [Lolium rigidum]|uniref:peptidyl-tRNA hydrolase 2, mitochondrial-like n=1 Tax=Lolium rigidum TaxID=89674 RepID=UPI001F5DDBA0|nr:peptidyl-tRNA hydrolase 2, mitochondrial-like [Lolium rigidum]
MGATASVLTLPMAASFPGAATAIAGAAGCFALGYLLALARLPLHAAAGPASGDDDSEEDSEEDDDENSGRAKRAAKRKRTGLRLLFWSRNVVTKSDSAREAERAQAQTAKAPLEIENLAKIIEDFKMVLVVRNDLKMGKGKIAAQCSHATLGLFKKLQQRAPKSLRRWERCGQVKVVVKVESEEDMLALQGRAKSLNLPTHITIDAGRTQIAPNSRTVMAILGPADMVDDVTGGLKLL